MLKEFAETGAQGLEALGANRWLQGELAGRSRRVTTLSIREVAEMLRLEPTGKYPYRLLSRMPAAEPDFPKGKKQGREHIYTVDDLMLIRAILQSRRDTRGCESQVKDPDRWLFWRQPGDPLTVATFGGQKRGTGKSLSAAHFAQFLSMQYGLRVGIIDADPQATVSLHFARAGLIREPMGTASTFMGADGLGGPRRSLEEHPAEFLHNLWQKTPWPGTKLLPGGGGIQKADLSFYFHLHQDDQVNRSPFLALKDAIQRWDRGKGPRTRPEDLRRDDGRFDLDRYREALDETLDVIVIDQNFSNAPTQMAGLMAANSIIIPQTMKGSDLHNLNGFHGRLAHLLALMEGHGHTPDVATGRHVVLPTLVDENNPAELALVKDLTREAPGGVAPIFYSRSDAAEKAAERYETIYEYVPPRTRRVSAKRFRESADAVNDHLTQVILPHLPAKGFAQAFIEERHSQIAD